MKSNKTYFLTFFFFVLISLNSFSQDHSIGVHIGPNFSKLSWRDVHTNTEFKVGFLAGINYQLSLSESLMGEANLIYFQQGFIAKHNFNDNMGNHAGTAKTIFNYDYVGLPVKIGVPMGSKIRIIPKIGLVPSILVSAKTKADLVENRKLIGTDISDVKDRVTPFDLAGLVEIGVKYPISNDFSVCSSASYRYSLNSFSNEDYFNRGNMHHYSYTLTLGIKYNLVN